LEMPFGAYDHNPHDTKRSKKFLLAA
jgi:hypothetical protein